MTHKEIEQYRKQLKEIIEDPIKDCSWENQPGTQTKLRELARKIGANTGDFKYDHTLETVSRVEASVSELIDNIHTALQTASTIDMCRTAAKNNRIARWTVGIAFAAVLAGGFFSFWANNIAHNALRRSSTPWLLVDDIKVTLISPRSFAINLSCHNFSDTPAFNLTLFPSIPGMATPSTPYRKHYKNSVLMPNSETAFSMLRTVPDGQAKSITEQLKTGKLPLFFVIKYEDVFGRKMEIHQRHRCFGKGFSNTKYDVIKKKSETIRFQ